MLDILLFSKEGSTKYGMLPSAVLNKSTRLLIGAGVLVNPQILLSEIESFNSINRTFIDAQCGIIEKGHLELDSTEDHLKSKIGTTGSGTGPANADRIISDPKACRASTNIT